MLLCFSILFFGFIHFYECLNFWSVMFSWIEFWYKNTLWSIRMQCNFWKWLSWFTWCIATMKKNNDHKFSREKKTAYIKKTSYFNFKTMLSRFTIVSCKNKMVQKKIVLWGDMTKEIRWKGLEESEKNRTNYKLWVRN